MRLIQLVPLLLLFCVARVHAQDARVAHVRGPGLVVTSEQLLHPAEPPLRLGLAPLDLSPDDFVDPPPSPGPASAAAPGIPLAAVLQLLAPPGFLLHRERREGARALAGLPPVRALPKSPEGGAVEQDSAGAPADSLPYRLPVTRIELPAVVAEAADLSLRVEGRGELGGAWDSYRPCEPGLRLNCEPPLFPQLKPNIQFGVQVGGTISDRIHVDVDYDQRREFDAANNINVYYEGLPGELLQRVEMGDVAIRLPASRYLTQGIPSGNFGFKAAAQIGATQVEAVWAQQKGDVAAREFRLGSGSGRDGLVQDQELILDDADYATGQFFFLVNPLDLVGAPHVDPLALRASDAPSGSRPQPGTLVLYRDEGVTANSYRDQAEEGKFLADALTRDGTVQHSGLFTLLEPGQDYYLHSSGLWIALRAPLRPDEALAAAYVTLAGDTLGDPVPELAGPGRTPELLLVRPPVTRHQPGQSTWLWELHNVYRLDSSAEVESSTLDLVISLGHAAGGATFEQHEGEQIPLLRLFGLDDDAPADRVDEAHVFRPGSEMQGFGQSALGGTFIVFPTLEPFGRPPPVPSEGLSAAETAEVLGTDANPAIYDDEDPVLRSSSSRFRLNFRYRTRLEGLLSSFNLGAFGIRAGTERITVEERLLVRGVDYVIDYDLGLVTLLDPATVLGSNPEAEIRATWEQPSLFEIAPTTVFGLHSRSELGEYGQLNVIGLYQAEQSMVRRPQLGMAPGAVLMGGASARVAFRAGWLARALEAVPLLSVDSTARVDMSAELAMSAPDPNRKGLTYLDDFESTDEIPLSLDATEWQLGSAPQDPAGVPGLPWPLTPQNAARLVWQDRYLADGREVGFLQPQAIDEQIALAGAQLAERVLYLTMDADVTTTASPPHWRAITTSLSPTGRDLSRSEYLEFYAAPLDPSVQGAVLVVDIGTVSEDAFYFDDTGALIGSGDRGRRWGLGELDEEARLALREVWGPSADASGLWDHYRTCEADGLNPVPLGSPDANCTAGNGRPDTEDLNRNGVLDDVDGPLFRYIIPLDASSPYMVRDRVATGTDFRLFRIPLRGGSGQALGGASEGSWRFVKQIRVTVVKPRPGEGTLAVARLRIAGSRWTKRDLHGVLSGRTGELPGSGAGTTAFRVGPVSQVTDGAAYSSPPGVEDEVQDPRSTIGASGVEFNEKSLRLSWDGLPARERAEVYFRYPQQPRSFLEYRDLRLWAVAREGSWGSSGDHRLLVKLGTDARNYYLYQAPLNPAAGGGGISAEDWLPEHVIDFGAWFALKAEAERRLIEGAGGLEPVVVWSADSTYAVVMEDRARAPNLAAIREIGFAVYNAGEGATTGEVWLDDLRLGTDAREPGFAGRVDLDLAAGGFLSAALSVGGRGGRFRQLDDVATYQRLDDLTLNTTAELGRFAPDSWGLSVPLTVSYLRTGSDPIFLQGTDIRADRLEGLRETASSRRRIGISLRKTTPSSNPLVSALIDGTSLRLGYVTADDGTVTTSSRLRGVDGGIQIDRRIGNVALDIVPAFVEAALRWLAPTRVEESAFFDRLTGARLRLTPERIGLSASYTNQDAQVWRFDRPYAADADSAVAPIETPRRGLDSSVRLSLRPLESVTANFGMTSARDLLEPATSTPLALERQALREARTELLGLPLGWESDRVVSSDLGYRPVIASWLQPSVSWTTRFGQRRDPSYLDIATTPEGQHATLLRTFNLDRRLSRGLLLDAAGAVRALFDLPGGSDLEAAGLPGILVSALSPLKPLDLTWTDEAGSRFDRELVQPDWGYQLGIGGLEPVRVLAGDTAATTIRRDGFRARSGLRLGESAALDIGYGETDARTLDRRIGGRDHLQRSWPDVQLSWQQIPVPSWAERVVDRWSMSTGFVRTDRVTTLLGDVQRVRALEERTVPLEVRLGFAGGLGLSYIGSLTLGDGRDPTGRTEEEALSHGVDLSGRFMAPLGLRNRFPQPVRLALGYDYQAQRHCREAGSLGLASDCTAFIDFINRRLNLSVSTLVSQLDVGLQLSYVDRSSFIGTQVGSSQLQLGLFGQFNIQAGTRAP